jgi:uncharacterized membrane protein YfcA
MEVHQAALLGAAGLAAGGVNAIAGGGSLITFPTLVAVGLPPVAANVSNALAVTPGYAASALGSRAALAGQGRRLAAIAPTAVLGAIGGCALLLVTPRRVFDLVVPFLVLGATAMLAFQTRLRRLVGHRRTASPTTPHVAVFLCGLYGGYFNAALGILLVAALALAIEESLNRIGALKNALSTVVGLVTVAVYSLFGPVNWTAVGIVAPTTLVGGYLGALLAGRLPARYLRGVIVTGGTAVGLLLLVRAVS